MTRGSGVYARKPLKGLIEFALETYGDDDDDDSRRQVNKLKRLLQVLEEP